MSLIWRNVDGPRSYSLQEIQQQDGLTNGINLLSQALSRFDENRKDVRGSELQARLAAIKSQEELAQAVDSGALFGSAGAGGYRTQDVQSVQALRDKLFQQNLQQNQENRAASSFNRENTRLDKLDAAVPTLIKQYNSASTSGKYDPTQIDVGGQDILGIMSGLNSASRGYSQDDRANKSLALNRARTAESLASSQQMRSIRAADFKNKLLGQSMATSINDIVANIPSTEERNALLLQMRESLPSSQRAAFDNVLGSKALGALSSEPESETYQSKLPELDASQFEANKRSVLGSIRDGTYAEMTNKLYAGIKAALPEGVPEKDLLYANAKGKELLEEGYPMELIPSLIGSGIAKESSWVPFFGSDSWGFNEDKINKQADFLRSNDVRNSLAETQDAIGEGSYLLRNSAKELSNLDQRIARAKTPAYKEGLIKEKNTLEQAVEALKKQIEPAVQESVKQEISPEEKQARDRLKRVNQLLNSAPNMQEAYILENERKKLIEQLRSYQ